MRISYRTHPVLECLVNGMPNPNIGWAEDCEWDKFRGIEEEFISNFNRSRPKFASNIIKMSQTFEKAMILSIPKLKNIYDEIFFSNYTISGTIIWQSYIMMYSYKSKLDKDVEASFYLFTKEGVIIGYVDTGEKDSFMFCDDPPEGILIDWTPIGLVARFISYILNVHIFTKYAEVETKTFIGGEKAIYQGQKTLNDTKLPITFLDSKWFTNLVKSDGFNVRGHFRLQPYGTGLHERKLIWINEFEKSGYTAPARKLQHSLN